ncbi:hypothetical protein BDW62DRAFT_204210 [Aspergillus aurantiobrunneus]
MESTASSQPNSYIGKQLRGVGVSKKGRLYQCFGTVTEVLESPIFVYASPENEYDGGHEDFQPFTYQQLRRHCDKFALAKRTGKLEPGYIPDRVYDEAIWFAPDGALMVGRGRATGATKIGETPYIFIVKPIKDERPRTRVRN